MNSNKKLNTAAYISFLVALAILIFAMFFAGSASNSINNEKLTSFNDGWQVQVNGKEIGTYSLPLNLDAKKGDVVRITNILPKELRQNSTLFFRTSQSFVNVFSDETELYSFGYNTRPLLGKSPSSAWQIVRIPIADFGHTISIEYVCPYQKYSGVINEVNIGTKAAIVFDILNQGLGSFVASILMFLIGAFLISIYFVAHASFKFNGLLHLGVFSIFFCLWSMSESKILQLFIGNATIISLLSYLSLFLLPIPLILFLNTLDILKNDKHLKVMAYFFISNFFVFISLQIFNIIDLFNLVAVFCVELLICILILVYKIARGIKRGGIEGYRILVAALIILWVFAIISTILFQFTNNIDNAMFMNIGFFIFLALIGYWSVRKTLKIYSLQIEKNTLTAMAYTDILTKLPNRAFFEQTISEYEIRRQSGVIIMFDLNGLKYINDNFSHKAGDSALVACARIIKESFAKVGRCYRIGGDEFCVVGDHNKAQHILAAANAMKAAIIKANANRECPIDIAFGYASFSPDTCTPEDALHTADIQMYANKAQMKSQNFNTSKIDDNGSTI